MIYRNIEKLVLDTPNNMELGEKLRELYWKEREENDRELDIWYVDNAAIANELELQKDADALLVDEDNNVIGTFFVEPALSSPLENLVDGLLGINDKPLTPPIKGSYKDELPPSDYQLDN